LLLTHANRGTKRNHELGTNCRREQQKNEGSFENTRSGCLPTTFETVPLIFTPGQQSVPFVALASIADVALFMKAVQLPIGPFQARRLAVNSQHNRANRPVDFFRHDPSGSPSHLWPRMEHGKHGFRSRHPNDFKLALEEQLAVRPFWQNEAQEAVGPTDRKGSVALLVVEPPRQGRIATE
jgi:hypothetical protein